MNSVGKIKRLTQGAIILSALMFGVILSATTMSQHSAKKVSFAENNQLSLTLSSVDVNRIFVLNDKITTINAPAGYFTAKNDPSGSVYLSVLNQQPFTLFITTASGRHFSILVISQAIVGKTYEFIPTDASKEVAAWEKDSDYQKLLTTLISGMIDHEVPDGYGVQDMIKQPIQKFYDVGDMTLLQIYTGDRLMGQVYGLRNKTSAPITLAPNSFYHPGVRAVALSNQTIAPGETAYIYEVVSKGESANG